MGARYNNFEELAEDKSQGNRVVPVESVEMYEIIAEMGPDVLRKEEAMVSTKYETVERKVKPATGPLPADSEQKRKEVSGDATLRKSVDIGHAFTDETWKNFRSVEVVSSHKMKKKNLVRCWNNMEKHLHSHQRR